MRTRTALLVAIVCTGAAFLQATEPMTVVDLIEVPQIQDPQLSPNGAQLLYVLSGADWKENKRISHVWRVETDGSGSVKLTNGAEGERSPQWSPDGSWIVFVAKRDDDKHEQLYLLSNLGGEARRLTEHASAVSAPSFSPDGVYVYFTASDPKTEDEKKKEELKDDVFSFDEDYKQEHLWRIRVADKSEERLTEGDFSVRGYDLSRDGAFVAHHRSPTPLFDNFDEGEVWLMRADGSEPRKLTENTVAESGAELSPDNEWVLFVSSSSADFDTYFNDNLFVVPAAGGPHRMLLSEMPYEVQRASWSADGSSIFFTANTGVRSELFEVELGGEVLTRLTEGEHSITDWRFFPSSGQHVFGIDRRDNAGDLHLMPADGGDPARVTRVYEYLAREFELPRQEAIQWKGDDGETVEGLLYYPLDYREGTRYPLVVQTHGGPAASDKFGFGRWSSYVQVLTAKGYFVFKPNYRGSTGYGDGFLRDMVGHYFRQAHLDVMTGVDHLIAEGLVDGERMVKMGWSGGGHMTNKIITFTDRFKAASSGAGAVNWISMYAQSDVRIYRTPWFGGTPWQEDAPIDTYWSHSPLKDIYKVKTPTIILVGEKDVRVPPPQSVELYRALKSLGVPTHLYIAPREPHGWQELRHELFKVNVELDWFEKHAMGRDYVWESAPGEEPEAPPKTTENP
ncbi:MAG TPA: S9 family peptidase [Vicinamibacteria bacterium]|nr:S9 family peptidase [Vicinamibacteria bacterium]